MKSSESQVNIAPALVKAVNAIEGVKKAAANPFFSSKYANLEAVIETAHGPLSENGLTVIQGPGPMQDKALTVTTRIIHESGEWIESDFSIPLAKHDPQSAGSAVTYARRYSLMAMLNMPAVDDDGNDAMPSRQAGTPAKLDVHEDGPDWYKASGPGMSSAAAKKMNLGEKLDGWLGDLETIPTGAALQAWAQENDQHIQEMPQGWRRMVREAWDRRGRELGIIG